MEKDSQSCTQSTKHVTLLNHQWDFIHNNYKYLALVCGIGAGKTHVLAHYLINRIAKYPKALHFCGANTYAQLKNSTLSAVFKVLNELEIPFSYNQSTGMLEFMGGRVLCKSMENYDALRGIEIGSFIIDEARDLRVEAFEVMMGRLRDKEVKGDLQGRLVTSPSGFNFIYDYFHEGGDKHTNEFRLIQACTMDNPFLPDGYIDTLKANFDAKLFRQEVLGEFVSIRQGQAYYAFKRDSNVADFAHMASPVWVGMDFNVSPLTAVLAYVDGYRRLHIFDEVFLKDSNTFEMCEILKKKAPNATIIPDSTGGNRTTASTVTNFDIIKNNGFKLIYNKNPFVIDRVNTLNLLLEQKKIIISPNCKKLINDLEKVTWKEGISKLDQTSDKDLTHISDALGYLAYYINPIRPNNIQPVTFS